MTNTNRTGRALYGIGNVLGTMKKWEESYVYHKRALLHFRETVGDTNHRTGNSCFKLAEHCIRQGRLSDAQYASTVSIVNTQLIFLACTWNEPS